MSKATDKWFRILKGIPLNEQASAEQLVQTFKAAYKNKTGDDYKDEKWLQQYAEKNPKGLAGEIERMGGAVGKPAADKEKLKKLMARGQRCNRAGFKGFGHEDVGDVKAALGKADYKVSEGNKYGIETLKAVIAFQKEKGLKVDGCVGPKTSGALGIEIKKPRTKIAGKEGKCRYKKRGNTRRTREFMQSSGFDYTEGQRGRIKIDPGWQKQNITRTKLHTGKTIKIQLFLRKLLKRHQKQVDTRQDRFKHKWPVTFCGIRQNQFQTTHTVWQSILTPERILMARILAK